MRPDKTVIDVRGVSKTFYDFWMRPKVKAVKGANLDVREGEIYGLLGPNGAGKSTTIKMLLGLLFPSKGQIRIMGRHPRDKNTKRFIGYMPEESYLYRYLNAEETLKFYSKIFGYSGKTADQRIEQLLDIVGLRGASHRPLHEYSKGMARRIALAQALINDPQLLILDEPTTGMDPIGTREFKDLILDLKARGKTIVICSHLLLDMQDLCDRVAVFYGGQIVSEGAVGELLKPGQNLEQYFLDAVAQAKAEDKEFTGATTGSKDLSLFSKLGASTESPEEASTDAVLDALQQEPTQPDPEPEQTESPTESAPEESEVPVGDASVLNDLAQPSESPTAAETREAAESTPQTEPAPATEESNAKEEPAQASSAAPEPDTSGAGDQDFLNSLMGSSESNDSDSK